MVRILSFYNKINLIIQIWDFVDGIVENERKKGKKLEEKQQ